MSPSGAGYAFSGLFAFCLEFAFVRWVMHGEVWFAVACGLISAVLTVVGGWAVARWL